MASDAHMEGDLPKKYDIMLGTSLQGPLLKVPIVLTHVKASSKNGAFMHTP